MADETTAAVQPNNPEAPAAPEQQAPAAPAGRPERRRGGPGRRPRNDGPRDDRQSEFVEKVVYVNRCAKVVKGGRRFSFSALIVVGDKKGRVGLGFGKANEVADAIRKATDAAKKRLDTVSLKGATIPHEVIGEFGGGRAYYRQSAFTVLPGPWRKRRGNGPCVIGGPLHLSCALELGKRKGRRGKNQPASFDFFLSGTIENSP